MRPCVASDIMGVEVLRLHIDGNDRDRLRALAARQKELSDLDSMKRLRNDWERHGRFEKGTRPMVRIELGTFAQDVLPPLIHCEGERARQIERRLLEATVNWEVFGDDTLVPDHYSIHRRAGMLPFGLEVLRENADGVGHHFVPYLHTLADDMHLLKPSTMHLDVEGEAREAEEAESLFGDLLPVKRDGFSLNTSLMQGIVHIMSMEEMYVAMLDEPELFHSMIARLADDYLRFFEWLEGAGNLQSANADEHLCQGSYCFTGELPSGKASASMKDMWLYMDSQETSGVSPELYREMVFPHYKRIMERCGLISYGCCEAVHGIWNDCLSTVANLRKVSISAWCDERFMGDALRGRNIVYLRKPTPNLLGVGSVLDEDAVRDCIRSTAVAASGCHLEIAQRDVYQLQNTPDKVRRYVDLIRDTLDRHYKPT